MGLNQRRLEPITWIAQEFQLADEGMQGMCRRGADLRGPAKFGSSKVEGCV